MADDKEEDDYMSDTIIAQCTAKDVRPSLLHNRAEKRKYEVLKKQVKDNEVYKRRYKPIKVLEQEGREAGLQKEIGNDNKGFQLLSKMGYKPGTSLGKPSEEINKRIIEPIPLEMKVDRKGLGQKTKQKEQMEKLESFRKQKKDLDEKFMDPEQFRIRAQAVANLKEMERDLRKAQSSCRHLDIHKEKKSPTEKWHWPAVEKQVKLDPDAPSKTVVEIDDEESDEDDFPPVPEMLKTLTDHLRREYFYCVWCGTSYNDWEDLISSCPGNSKDEH